MQTQKVNSVKENSPLCDIHWKDGKTGEIHNTATGWYYRTASGLTATVKGYEDGIICRVNPGADRDIVQLGIGKTTSALCNAVFSPRKDEAIVFLSDTLMDEKWDGLSFSPESLGLKYSYSGEVTVSCSGPLKVAVIEKYMKIHRDQPWYSLMDRSVFKRPPSGWLTWYYYYLDITEDELVKNTDWLADNLKKFGCEWVQIDEGWEGPDKGYGSNRDWSCERKPTFPKGMKWCSEYIRSKGFRPGIWCVPYTESDTKLWESNPKAFIHREDGTSAGELTEPNPYTWMEDSERMYPWDGRYIVDLTSQEGKEFIDKLFRLLCDKWGYDYVKIDGQSRIANHYEHWRKRLADPTQDGERVAREMSKRIKSVMGPERFLLNCIAGYESTGYCEGMRTGGDMQAGSWEGLKVSIACTMEKLFLNTLAFYTDPDCLCVREPLELEQARLLTNIVGITGQVLMMSDKMYELPDERVELLRRVLPVADIHPMELYPLDRNDIPSIFDVKVEREGVGSWDVVSLFNWDENGTKKFELSPKRLGREIKGWVCMDFWNGMLLYAGDGSYEAEVPARSSLLLSFWPMLGRPQFVGSNRHIMQGTDDVESLTWDDEKNVLSGISHVVAGDPYKVRLYVPYGYRMKDTGIYIKKNLAELTINSDENRKVSWSVAFIKE